MERKNAWAAYAGDDGRVEAFAKAYCDFINNGKTERECVAYGEKLAKAHGFEDLNAAVRSGRKLEAGARVYANWMGKSFMLFVLGEKPLEEGMNILGAHIDSPRIDVKQNPLYEDTDLAYLDTHYYGGIKKYQWPTVPMSLHGVIVKSDGSKVTVRIGEDEGDPVFVVTDLLPHLAEEQYKRPATKLIKGEELNILIGSRPFRDDKISEKVKLNLMNILFEKYGIVEKDFLSAELECVPAFKAKDVGFDRSLVGAYGQDDRVCAYTAFTAIIDMKAVPEKTAVCIFADKEEIGSEGVSGMQGEVFEYFMESLCKAQGVDLRTCLANSFCLSADVCAAFDPGFSEVFERKNAAYLNYGVGLCKYTGSGGKSGASDASSEVVGKIRRLLNDHKIAWQMCELGKTDAGGGGTVAKYMAKRNIDTLDAGVPVLSMHAPFEVVAKYDCYMTYRAVKAIFEEN